MEFKNEKLNVLGIHKTGTSTVVGILNCHPDIFCYFEYRPDGKLKKKHIIWPKLNRKYRWVGDKNPRLGEPFESDLRIERYNINTNIFCYRELDNWLCHRKIIALYATDLDVILPTVNYIYYLLQSFKLDKVMHIKFENFIENYEGVLKKLGEFLEVDGAHFERWWEKVGTWKDFNKQQYKWWKGHKCARHKPQRDIVVKRKEHEFWSIVDPIIERPQDFMDFNVYELNRFFPLPLSDIIEKSSGISSIQEEEYK